MGSKWTGGYREADGFRLQKGEEVCLFEGVADQTMWNSLRLASSECPAQSTFVH